jgi:hypothetical protein
MFDVFKTEIVPELRAICQSKSWHETQTTRRLAGDRGDADKGRFFVVYAPLEKCTRRQAE